MLSALLLVLGLLAIWTLIALFKKDARDPEIKSVLMEMVIDSVKLFSDFKKLFKLLREVIPSQNSQGLEPISEKSPKLIAIKKDKRDQAA